MESGVISVVVPVYNSAIYLDKCIQSILKQSYPNWELILVDDGSTDESGSICDKYAREYANIKCIHQENRGVSIARNTGIEASRGEFLSFVDSDDVVSAEYLEHLISILKLHNCDWSLSAVGNYHEFSPQQKILLDFNQLSAEDFLKLNTAYVLFGPVCKLYKAEIIKRHQIRFPEGIHYGEDLLFNFAYMEHIHSAVFWNVNDYTYEKVNDTSLSTRYRKTMFEEELFLSNVKISFYKKKGVYNRDFERFVHDGIFDMGYNAILKSYFRGDNENIKAHISGILNNEVFQEAARDVPGGKYSSFIMFMMKHKLVYCLMFYLKMHIYVQRRGYA